MENKVVNFGGPVRTESILQFSIPEGIHQRAGLYSLYNQNLKNFLVQKTYQVLN